MALALKTATRKKMKTKLIHITPDAEKVMTYCARVSSPHQDSDQLKGLLTYCIKNKHWSVFEMATMCIEIETSRAIAQQILRHRSFHFQEFSQRYAEVNAFELYEARSQDLKNRQNSIDDMSTEDKDWFEHTQMQSAMFSMDSYNEALKRGIAKEQARFLLPLSVRTKLYMHGTIRDWIHYISLRIENGTQKEHKDIASSIKYIMIEQLPIVTQALEWRA